ncbi:MAG TPA: Fe-S protein assembly co-chaperone HscB [Anaeromyxobacteraceae bacterium]|nr:Fe-S protein assembly co-chaperone HscB [Anaeromyxobacteraceae bacterium]
MACWSCRAEVPRDDLLCPACRRLQALEPGADHFAAMGLPRRFGLDPAALERRYKDLSRQLHPDRFARADPRERLISLDRSTRLNDAWRTLRDERSRAEYLLRLRGIDPAGEGRAAPDPEFLEAQLEVREALAEARARGDDATRRRIAREGRERLAGLLAEVAALFGEAEAGGPDRAADIARRLARARYHDSVIADAEGAAPAR